VAWQITESAREELSIGFHIFAATAFLPAVNTLTRLRSCEFEFFAETEEDEGNSAERLLPGYCRCMTGIFLQNGLKLHFLTGLIRAPLLAQRGRENGVIVRGVWI
jgi:hypothetical protein